MLGQEGSQTATKLWTLSWLVFVLLSKATPAQPCQKQAGLSCSSQRWVSLVPPPRKGCCAANKEVSNAFWVSSSLTHSPLPPPPGAGTHTLRNASLPRCYQAWQRRCTGKPCPEKEFPVMQFLSSPAFRHGETLWAALFTPPSRMSQICCVPSKAQLYQVLTISSSSPCPPSSCTTSAVCVAKLWNKFGDTSVFSILNEIPCPISQCGHKLWLHTWPHNELQQSQYQESRDT